ncbi:uncharacterized protein [Zea mays]|uniref:uncharacterized protein n=1 Tax=Zea mays TaxID=4577 RepID=UPI0009AA4637|nr:uncharacterized protein LOC103640902 [Zea mays]
MCHLKLLCQNIMVKASVYWDLFFILQMIFLKETNPHVQSYKKIKLGCGCSCVASSCWTEEREGRSSWRADFYSGGLLFSMGLLGYIFSRSTISLVLGITPGLATLLLGTLSLKFWRSDRSSFLLILAQAEVMLMCKHLHLEFCLARMNQVYFPILLHLRQIEQGFVWLPNGLLVLK